jgi:hypothetical protein
MAGTKWSWEQTPFGWWTGQRVGFDGKVSVFERMGAWCARIEISNGLTFDLTHFSEGHYSDTVARIIAEKSAERSMQFRQSCVGVPRV